MLSCSKKIIVILVISLLSACNTTSSKLENDKLTRTALLNTRLGMAYLEKNEVQPAKQKLLLALEEAPNIPETWYSMAYFLEKTGNPIDAKKYYLKAISLAPSNGEAQNNYGTFLCRAGDYQEAISHFLQAVKDTNYLDTASAYENAGLCALKIPDNKLAMQYFHHAVQEDPTMTTSIDEIQHNAPQKPGRKKWSYLSF